MRQHLLQVFQFVPETLIAVELALDLADRVQHSCMITIAEPAADFRQRPGGQLLGQPHADLARPDYGPVTPLREKIALRNAEVTRHHPQDVLDLDPALIAARMYRSRITVSAMSGVSVPRTCCQV